MIKVHIFHAGKVLVVRASPYAGMQKGTFMIIPTLPFKAEKAALGLLPAKMSVAFIRNWQKRLIEQNH